MEISRRKLYVLGRIINSSSTQAFRELFVRRLIKWKWRYDPVDGFIPDLIGILEKHGLMIFMADFITSESFPTKKHWERIVNEAVQGKEELAWSEKLNQKPVLKLYMQAHQHLDISFWYEIWDFSPMNSNIVVDVIRLLYGSLKIVGIRIENYNCLHSRFVINPIHHALLYCMNTATQREYWWTWTTDDLSEDIMVLLNFLDDDQFVQLITGGKQANLATIMDSLNIDFWFRCAEYVSFCMQNSLFEPFA
jgi:hypothetical protein